MALELELEERRELSVVQLHQLQLPVLQDQLHELVPVHDERQLEVEVLPQLRQQRLLPDLQVVALTLHLAEDHPWHLLRTLEGERRVRRTLWERFKPCTKSELMTRDTVRSKRNQFHHAAPVALFLLLSDGYLQNLLSSVRIYFSLYEIEVSAAIAEGVGLQRERL